MFKKFFIVLFVVGFFFSCQKKENDTKIAQDSISPQIYIKKVKLSTSYSFSDSEKQVLKLLFHAAKFADSMYFYENFEDYRIVLDTLKDSTLLQKFINNFGPWERFNENKPFIKGVGPKPLGANFYPPDITRLEFYEYEDSCKNSPYTFIRRNKDSSLYCLPYHVKFKNYIDSISYILNEAAGLVDNKKFADFLRQRVIDMKNDDYYKSDSMWINLSSNKIDFFIGPIIVSLDRFMNIKAEHHAMVLVKDLDWTVRMEKYTKWLIFLQKAIPVPDEYKAEDPGKGSSIVVYDALFYGGSGKAEGTLISEIFPLNPKIQISEGVKNIQFKNVIEYKFDAISKAIAQKALVPQQAQQVTAQAFFENTILYEMANSLGIRNTINGKGTVRKALKNYFKIADYLKNYTLSLFLADKLNEVNELSSEIEQNYYTYVVDLLRLIRFGSDNDYAITNLIIYNYLVDYGAIKYKAGHLYIDFETMQKANNDLIKKIIIMEGNGDYEGFKNFVEKYNYKDKNLQNLIYMLNTDTIPTDIYVVPDYSIFK